MSVDPRKAAVTALRLASAAVLTADTLATGPYAWILEATASVLTNTAELVAAGPGWMEAHRVATADLITESVGAIPGVRPRDATRFGRGVVAGVDVVRSVAGL
jgi:hypothetical protein